jgi:hypothetical protein
MGTLTTLYDEDFYAWTLATAELIRKQQWQAIDWEHVLEELKSLGKRDKRELESRLEVLVMHLLKWWAQPERRRRNRSWRSPVLEQRGQIQRLLDDSPSLRPQIPVLLAQRYARARQRTLAEAGLAESAMPETCP